MGISFEQSAPLCYLLSAIGGMLEVGSTAVLAVPDAREKEGFKYTDIQKLGFLAANISMQLLGSLSSNLFAAWFGPVSIVGPISLCAQLMSNMIIFGFLLGLEFFNKNMRIGTYVIVVATVLLPVVGPSTQENQDAFALLSTGYGFIWMILLNVGMIITTILLVCDITKYKLNLTRMIILIICRSTSFSINLTVSRAVVLVDKHWVIILLIIIKVISGAIYAYAIVIQSTTVEQNKFVPLNSTLTIVVNAFTGIIIWEDWKVIGSWVGYGCIFWLLGIGCELLLSIPILTKENKDFGYKRRNTMIRRGTLIMYHPDSYLNYDAIKEVQDFASDHNLYGSTSYDNDDDDDDDDDEKNHEDKFNDEEEDTTDTRIKKNVSLVDVDEEEAVEEAKQDEISSSAKTADGSGSGSSPKHASFASGIVSSSSKLINNGVVDSIHSKLQKLPSRKLAWEKVTGISTRRLNADNNEGRGSSTPSGKKRSFTSDF